jgi:6-phosphogluconolactonase (cycloisomerase 2 family)
MRMKFNKTSQLLLVSAASLLAAGALAACGTATVDFVYVASSQAVANNNNYGEINVFEINQTSGFMRQIPTSPFPSAGRQPVAEAVSQDYTNLYVVDQDDNSIVQFLIGSDGKLYPQNTVNTPGIFPLAEAVSSSYLFVADTYQPLSSCTKATPCSGSVGVFPILTAAQAQALTPPQIADTLGSPVANPANGANYWPLTLPGKSSSDILQPTGICVSASGANVYVSAYDTTANTGYLFAFAVGAGGVLSAETGSPYAAGTHPSSVAGDSTSSFIYVTDFANADVLGFSATSGGLTPLSGTYATGNHPSSIAVDPKYPYAFVANALDGTVNAYSVGASGALTNLGTYATGVDPVAIGIDPGTSHFVFTANFLGNGAVGTVSNFELNTSNGTLTNAQHSPFNSNALPTAVAAVPHTPQLR